MDTQRDQQTDYEVVVTGGGAAGLSAAVALARSRRSVLVIDAGEQRNAPAEGVHNFLSREGVSPLELVALGREELREYGGEIRVGEVVDAESGGDIVAVTLADGTRISGRRLIVATGVRDLLPDLPGLREQWGHHVLHCPYCHGWEVRDRRIGVLASGPMAAHQALMFGQLSPHTQVLAHTAPPSEHDRARLEAAGIPVTEGEVVAVETDADGVTGVRMADGTTISLDAVVVGPPVVPLLDGLDGLGLDLVPHPMGAELGSMVGVDPMGRTNVPHVFAAGNVTDVSAQVMASAAMGTKVGAVVNMDLIEADVTARMPSGVGA